MFKLNSKVYELARIGLARAACPREVADNADNVRFGIAIRVEHNRAGAGRVAALRYAPGGIVVAGGALRTCMLEAGMVHGYAFVEAGALTIKASEAISSSDLMTMLRRALYDKLFGVGKEPMTGQTWPSIMQIYPFNNYFIFYLGNQKYRQDYVLDAAMRAVRLPVGATKVEEVFVSKVDACGGTMSQMPRVQTGIRYATAPVVPHGQSVTRGAANSELVTQVLRDWTNIMKAVNNYLTAIRGGQHKPLPVAPMFAPVKILPGGKLGAKVAAKGVDVFDFVRWSAKVQATLRAGGPGSGPHKGGSKAIGDVLKSRNFTQVATTSDGHKQYSHPHGDTVMTKGDSWMHNEMGKTPKSGNGGDALHERLAKRFD